MKTEDIQAVIENLTSVERKSSYIKVSGMPNKPHHLSTDNFVSVEIDSDAASKTVTFIDGGNAEILSSASFSVHFIRLCAVTYTGLERINVDRKEFYVVIQARGDSFSVETVGEGYTFDSFSSDDETLRNGPSVDISSLGGVVRRFSELKYCAEQNADLIVLDGSLFPTVTGEEKLVDMLRSKRTIGLAKTCTLVCDSGESALTFLQKTAPEGRWLYHPVCAIDRYDIAFCKLHPHAQHAFRIDGFLVEKTSLGLLAFHARDPIFLGYPYGLVAVDRFARVSNEEKEILKMKFAVAAKDKYGVLSTEINTRNAHSILDSV